MAERETERTVKKRAESDPAYQWHIQDLYAADETWEKDYEVLAGQAKELAAYEGRLKEGSEVFVEYMRKKEEVMKKPYMFMPISDIMKIQGIVFIRGLQERHRHYLYSLTAQLYLKSRNF